MDQCLYRDERLSWVRSHFGPKELGRAFSGFKILSKRVGVVRQGYQEVLWTKE